MECTKLENDGPFFAKEDSQCACDVREGWRESLMTGREGAVAVICGLVGAAAGGQTDGWLGVVVGAFVCGCLGALGTMMMPERGTRATPPTDEAARARLREAVQAGAGAEAHGVAALQTSGTRG